MLHVLPANKETVHWGYFDCSIRPALRIKSGDLVRTEAITHHAGDAPDLLMDERIRQLYADIPEDDRNPGVHILTGPIYVEGAKPGDMLEVRYYEMTPRFKYGSNLAANWGYLAKEFEQKERVTIYCVDTDSMQAEGLFAYDYPGEYLTPGKIMDLAKCNCCKALAGFRVPLRPHLGTAGVAPNVKGRVSSVPPGAHGGNIDNWRIAAGSTMYYPVAVDGALFSVGDPHVSQGDGEVSGTAIEASLNVLMQISVRKDFQFPTPLLETPKHWIVHGFDEDLNVATRNASMDMLRMLSDKGVSRDDAYSLMSVAADYAVTQVVDGKRGVHIRLPRSVFPMKGRKTAALPPGEER